MFVVLVVFSFFCWFSRVVPSNLLLCLVGWRLLARSFVVAGGGCCWLCILQVRFVSSTRFRFYNWVGRYYINILIDIPWHCNYTNAFGEPLSFSQMVMPNKLRCRETAKCMRKAHSDCSQIVCILNNNILRAHRKIRTEHVAKVGFCDGCICRGRDHYD